MQPPQVHQGFVRRLHAVLMANAMRISRIFSPNGLLYLDICIVVRVHDAIVTPAWTPKFPRGLGSRHAILIDNSEPLLLLLLGNKREKSTNLWDGGEKCQFFL